jgi:hypothetical protein
MFRSSSHAMDVSIHRARQQLALAGVFGAAGIVESRGHRRRIGVSLLVVATE